MTSELYELTKEVFEHVWYKLTPDRIELIYGEKFGHERQKVK
jgi:hypothetical protein